MDENIFLGVETTKLIARAGTEFGDVVAGAVQYAVSISGGKTSPIVQFDFGGHTFDVDQHTDVAKFVREGKAKLKKP